MTELLDQLRAALAGGYTLERELGRGGMAAVYLARDIKHDRPVALKVLHPELAQALGPERFLREVRLAARLQHPHILTVLDSGNANGHLWYTMPYVVGESLRDRLRREPQFPVGDAVRIAREVAEALAHAHQHGIVHRDVKPENILLSGQPPGGQYQEESHAMLADFGVAKGPAGVDERLTETGFSLGTPAYMSPEQATGSPVDGRSDLYSLGCVLYEMLAGEPPFRGPTAQAMIARRLTDPVPRVRQQRPAVPAHIEDAISWALAATPADRVPDARAFLGSLDPATTAGAPGRTAPRRPEAGVVRRPRWRRLLIAGAAIILAALATWTWRQSGASPAPGHASVSHAVPSVAVLTLRSVGRDPDAAYLETGLAEELTARLTRVGGLRVKSRRAVEAAEPAALADPAEAGRALGVRYLVDGTLRREDSLIRVSVRLLETEGGFQLWSQDFAVTAAELVPVEDSVARHVAALAGATPAAARAGTTSPQPTRSATAYDHYLRGSYHLARRTPHAVARAIREYEAALRADSAFTEALARTAYAYTLFLDWGWRLPGVPETEIRSRALALTDRALEQDPRSPEVWLARAYLLTQLDPERMEGAVPTFQRALALDSTRSEAFYQYGQTLMALGRNDEALAAYHQALALEPERPMTLVPMASLEWKGGRLDQARRWADSAVALAGPVPAPYAYAFRATIRLAQKDADGARRDAELALAVDSSYAVPARSMLARALARQGNAAEASRQVGLALARMHQPPSPTDARFLASALVELGRDGEALDLIEQARPRGAWLWYYLQAPDLARLQSSPRFRRLLEALSPVRPHGGP